MTRFCRQPKIEHTHPGRAARRKDLGPQGLGEVALRCIRPHLSGGAAPRTLPDNTTQPDEQWAYDGYGRVATHQTADGEVIAAEYDGRGDLVRQRWASYSGGGSDILTQFVWDELGRKVGATDTNLGRSRVGLPPVSVFRTWTRDALNRVVMETTQVGTTAPHVTLSDWQLQPDGWTRELTYPSGKVVTRQLDEVGRLTTVQIGGRAIAMEHVGAAYTGRTHVWSSSAAVDPMRHFVGLDGLGRGVDFATTMLDRSATGAPSNSAWADDYCEGSYDADICGAPIFAQQLVRDAQGRTRSVGTLWGNAERGLLSERAAPWRGYNYDAEGRLTTVFEHDGVGETVSALAVPSHAVRNADLWNLTNAYATTEAPILPVHWQREADVGGLTAVVEQDGATRWASGGRLPGHQLSSVSLDGASYTLAHDAVGRVTTGAGATYVYDVFGRLVRGSRDGFDEHFVYDADHRLTVIDGSNATTIVYDGEQLIAAMNADGTARWEVVAGATDQLLEYSSGSEHLVPITDHRNSIVGWWDANAEQLRNVIEYTPHGRLRVLAPDGTVQCTEEGTGADCQRQQELPPFGFASLLRAHHTGLVYMRARWYAPRLGQFLSHDPLGTIDRHNLYAYAAMDPINFWDPFGLSAGGFANPGKNKRNNDNVQIEAPWSLPQRIALRMDDEARRLGEANRAFTEWVHDKNKPDPDDSTSETVARAVAQGVIEIYRVMTPQSGDDVIMETAIFAATFGTGTIVRGGAKLFRRKPTREALAKTVVNTSRKLCSFTAGTVVLMCDGTYQPIETVQEGQWVLARDELTGEVACKEVVHPYANPDRSIIVLTLQAEDGTLEVIETTDNHPFYVADRGWTRADDLAPDDLVPAANGAHLTVVSAMWTDRVETVYNFGVEGFHTYFVGESEAWVHNCYDELRDILGTMSREEFERLSARWAPHARTSEQFRHHANKHGNDDLAAYLRRADAFNKRGARRKELSGGRVKYEKGNGEFMIELDGMFVTYGKN